MSFLIRSPHPGSQQQKHSCSEQCVNEILMTGLGSDHTHPYLVSLVNQELVVYKTFPFEQTKNPGHLSVRFSKVLYTVHSLYTVLDCSVVVTYNLNHKVLKNHKNVWRRVITFKLLSFYQNFTWMLHIVMVLYGKLINDNCLLGSSQGVA